jgi:hypothetical protein
MQLLGFELYLYISQFHIPSKAAETSGFLPLNPVNPAAPFGFTSRLITPSKSTSFVSFYRPMVYVYSLYDQEILEYVSKVSIQLQTKTH